MCFVDIENACDKFSSIVVKWAIRKKGIPEELVGTVMSLYKGAGTW